MYTIIVRRKLMCVELLYVRNSVFYVIDLKCVLLVLPQCVAVIQVDSRRGEHRIKSLIVLHPGFAMSDAPLLICPKCCSLDIEGPESPDNDDVMHCRQCGYSLTYGEMHEEIRVALGSAIRLIHMRIAHRMGLNARQSA
jgi:hypothetical protein